MTILAMDQGTTSSRALIFSDDLRVRASAQQEFPQHFPRSGWVEHDPDDIWTTSAATARGPALEHVDLGSVPEHDVAQIQRERARSWAWRSRSTRLASVAARRRALRALGVDPDAPSPEPVPARRHAWWR